VAGTEDREDSHRILILNIEFSLAVAICQKNMQSPKVERSNSSHIHTWQASLAYCYHIITTELTIPPPPVHHTIKHSASSKMSSSMSANAATCSTTNNFSASPEESVAYCLALVSSSATSTISSFDLNGPNEESFPFRDSIDVARTRLGRSFSSATSSTGDSLSVLSTGDLQSLYSLEVARKSIALKHERQRAAHSPVSSADLSAKGDSAGVSTAAGTTIGFALARGSDLNAARPWAHHLAHNNSIDLPRERMVREKVAHRRAHALRFKQRFYAKVEALATGFGTACTRAKCVCFHKGLMPDKDISVNGRPIEILRSTGHKMVSRDYEAHEYGVTRLEALEILAKTDGTTDVAAWCRRKGIRL
jgi:hypothetical protein